MYRCKTSIKLVFILLFCLNLSASNTDNNQSDESFMILKGLNFEDEDPTNSSKIFEYLYDSTKNPEYLKEAIKIAFAYKSKNLGDIVEKGKVVLKDDDDYLRMRVAYLMENSKPDEALLIMKKMVKANPSAKNYSILGVVQDILNSNKEALVSFKKAYSIEQNDENLLRMVDLLLNKFGNVKEATTELETYKRLKGCSVLVCNVLSDIYKRNHNYPMLIKTYEDIYKSTKDTQYLDEIIKFYLINKDFNKTKNLLEKYDYNNKLLLEIYGFNKEFDKAIKKADELYKKSGDMEFLAIEAMFLYEKNGANLDKKILKDILNKFEKSMPNLDIAMLENYYGYLLIDHEIDVKKGINLVKKALLKEPNSPYFLDSLAWGHFKLNECKKADEVMKSIDKSEKEFFKSEEAKEHIKAIKKCLKGVEK
ncbi:hypothetical protein [Campylobacter geochelonis]|uniref:hypothetical protein n=1 Tax=Campylobacter geochelonis TaxID=1780362 RepID=UPI000770B705|nr:hypothetical protein [Campylobacter geochelonis]CZE47825.1 TPR repeat-containing protein [Campylobacter geochelonis]CZE50858.1 TPR repeat-containing protein [Campylobacter geochelonis]